MARKTQEINPNSAERLKILCVTNNMTQAELSQKTGISQNTISKIIQGKSALSPAVAMEILKIAEFKNVRIEWLLGADNYKTEMDRLRSALGKMNDISDLIHRLVMSHGYKIEEVDNVGDPLATDAFGEKIVYLTSGDGTTRYASKVKWDSMVKHIYAYIDFCCKQMPPTHPKKK